MPPSGRQNASLMIVGLAPGKHGANRTGVPFTGDASGELLFTTLKKLSLTSKVIITNAVKCLPIRNKPNSAEIRNCQRYLIPEVTAHRHKSSAVFLALGRVAHEAVLRALGLTLAHYRFAHGACHKLPGAVILVDSYHCSRYNIQTRRLTPDMFEDAVVSAAEYSGLCGGNQDCQ